MTAAEQIKVQCKVLDPKPGQVVVIEHPPGDVQGIEECRSVGRVIAETTGAEVVLCPSPYTIRAVDSVLMVEFNKVKAAWKQEEFDTAIAAKARGG